MIVLAQALSEKYVSMLEKAYDGNIDILTGSTIEKKENRRVFSTRKYKSNSFGARIRSWCEYYQDVFRIIKKENLQPEVIFAISNPPINSIISYRLKKKYKCKVIFMDWDIYPNLIERTFKNPIIQLMCKVWHGINNYIFPKLDLILTIGEYMKKSIEAGIKKPIQIRVISLFTECGRLKPIDKEKNEFCKGRDLTEKIVFMYSGKMGMGHNLDIILDAAKELQYESRIHFLLIGEGQRYKKVEDRIAEEQFENVTLLPFQSEEVFPLSLACGDVALVTQESSLANLFLPSKAYDMMAVGMPIIGICTKEDDLAELIVSNGIGKIVTDSKVETLVETIREFVDNDELRERYAYTARKCAEEKYDETIVVRQYRDLFDVMEERET